MARGALVVLAVVVAVLAYVAQSADAASAAPRAEERRCFGAASRAPGRPCRDPALARTVSPRPYQALLAPNAPCGTSLELPETGLVAPCVFGTPSADARGDFLLLGDSHAAHWRGAVRRVAAKRRWRGITVMRTSCPFSMAARSYGFAQRTSCSRWNRQAVDWLRRHPRVRTVLVSANSETTVVDDVGVGQFEANVRGYLAAWRSLPASVTRIVVLRDVPQRAPQTFDCVLEAMSRNVSPGRTCAVARGAVLPADPQVAAVRRMGGGRVKLVDLSRHFCSATLCFPVVGGALVNKDRGHMTNAFSVSLGPFLETRLAGLVDIGEGRPVAEVEPVAAPAPPEPPGVTAGRPCFGAASRDPFVPCRNADLRLAVAPAPGTAELEREASCTRLPAEGLLTPCRFGADPADAVGDAALIGDGSAAQWRAAVAHVAVRKRWRATSITRAGCPLSAAQPPVGTAGRKACVRWNGEVVAWLERHPEVRTVFLSADATSPVERRAGASISETRAAGYEEVLRALPASVDRVFVLRDLPHRQGQTEQCVVRALVARREAGVACAVPRSRALLVDHAALAARRVGGRAREVNLSRFACSPRLCSPVVGGALVHRDDARLSTAFAASLGPYLLRHVDNAEREADGQPAEGVPPSSGTSS